METGIIVLGVAILLYTLYSVARLVLDIVDKKKKNKVENKEKGDINSGSNSCSFD